MTINLHHGVADFDVDYDPDLRSVEISVSVSDSDDVLISIDDVVGPTHARAKIIEAFTAMGAAVAHALVDNPAVFPGRSGA